jgi:hypothetical protein
MSLPPEPSYSVDLKLLLFSLAGVFFGIDVAQIEAMFAYDGEEAQDLFRFHEELGIDGKAIVYNTPTVLTVRTEDSRKYRVIIDGPEDLVDICMDEIRPFPRIMAPSLIRKGMWGVVLRGKRKILLVDFLHLLRQRSAIKDHEGKGGNG